MKQAILLILLLSPFLSHSQVSLLQSQGGSTSFQVGNGGIFVNTGESSISGSFAIGKGGAGLVNHFGINAKFKSTESVTTLLDGNKFKAQVEGSVYYIHGLKSDILFHPSRIHYFYYLGGIKYAKYNLLPTATSTDFEEKAFLGINLTLGYNQINAWGKSPTFLGVSVTGGNFNNVDSDLKSVERYSVNTVTTSTQQISVLKDKSGGFEGIYKESKGVRINFDGYVYPHFIKGDKVGFGGFGRVLLGETYSTSTAGVGAVFGNAFDTGTAVLGIFYQFQNFFNETSDGVSQKLSLTAGYNF